MAALNSAGSAKVTCPVCGERIAVAFRNGRTSDLAPGGRSAVVFIEPDMSNLQRHLAVHAVEAEEAAA